MSEVTVFKRRTNKLRVSLGFDVSGDTFASEIREKATFSSPKIATWSWAFVTDGTDGEILLTCDDSELLAVTVKSGYMDIKRISGGEPLAVYAPIKVNFIETVTE